MFHKMFHKKLSCVFKQNMYLNSNLLKKKNYFNKLLILNW